MSTEGGAASSGANPSSGNEDAYLVHDSMGLYVVADGASQRAAGEEAARIAVSVLEEVIRERRPSGLAAILSTFPSRRAVRDAMRTAMLRVVEASEASTALVGMTTTVSMVLADHEKAFVCNAGDSRVYLVRAGELHLLTSDHDLSLVPGGTSADTYRDVPIEVFSVDLMDADIFLLCTDGAEQALEAMDLADRIAEMSPRAIATELVAAARRMDSANDATVVAIRIVEDEESGWMEVSEPLSPWAYGYAVDYAEIG